MTTQAFRTMIAPSEQAPLARQICATLAPSGGAGMFGVGLSATGAEPATHYVSTGYIDADFADLMPLDVLEQDVDGDWISVGYFPGQPEAVAALCAEAGLVVTQAEVKAMFAVADVTTQEPFTAFDRLGLQMIQETG